MGDKSEADDQFQKLVEYLGGPPHSQTIFSPENKQEDDILNSILAAFRDHKKFYVEIVKSFDIENLNSVFIYIYRQLEKNGVKIKLLKSLNFMDTERENDSKYIYLITEKYLDISDSETLTKIISLISGHLPSNLVGIPILLGITENTLRYLDKYRAENVNTSVLNRMDDPLTHSRFIGVGLALFSFTFFITLFGIIIDRPGILPLSLSEVSWIVFSTSFLGITGFTLVIFGSMDIPSSKVKLIGKIILVIALCEAASILLQLSKFSLLFPSNGLHLVLITPGNSLSSITNLNAAGVIPIIYSVISVILAIAFYFLAQHFSKGIFKKVTSIALYTAIIAELLSILIIIRGDAGYNLEYFVVYQAKYFYLSFYNNVSPVMPYPTINLNTADFFFTFGNYSTGFFYFILATGAASNLLFFISFLSAGILTFGKGKKRSTTNAHGSN